MLIGSMLSADINVIQNRLNKVRLKHVSFLSLFLEHKVIIVGLDNAGKTTILYQL